MRHSTKYIFATTAFVVSMTLVPSVQAAAGLKNYMPFKLGVAVSNAQMADLDGKDMQIVERHFNQIVAENGMKPESLQPVEGMWDFEKADALVNWAKARGMKVMGHVLIWHEQLPRWFFVDDNGREVSREKLLERMKTHITKVVTHFKGRVDGWDVVNEAIEGDGSYRNSRFLKIIGEDFIDYAFKFAHEADPDCELWYNDYGNESKAKNNTIAALVRRLKSKGIRIDGVGMQTHVQLDYPAIATYEDAIKTISATGVKIAITEFDISVLPSAWNLTADITTKIEYKEKYNPWPVALPADVDAKLGERYAEFFDLFRKYAKTIDRVTLWGLSDRDSWLNNFPVFGRTDYPLFFDRDLKLKRWTAKLCKVQKTK